MNYLCVKMIYNTVFCEILALFYTVHLYIRVCVFITCSKSYHLYDTLMDPCVCMYVCMYVCMCVCVCVCVCMYVRTYVCTHICMYVCIFFIYLQHAPLHPVILHACRKLCHIYSIYIFADCSFTVIRNRWSFVKLVNCFKYLFTNSLFFTGQLSSFEIMLLVFLFHCFVCCIDTVDDPLFGFC